jgi:hypothetical protein
VWLTPLIPSDTLVSNKAYKVARFFYRLVRKQSSMSDYCYTYGVEVLTIERDKHWRQTGAAPPCSLASGRTTTFFKGSDEVLTRQCPCLGLSIHGAYVGAWRIRRLQTETGVHMNLPRFDPPGGKDLHPACLILYCLDSWCCYNGAQMGSGYGRKGDGMC